jgi:hypothetical protein
MDPCSRRERAFHDQKFIRAGRRSAHNAAIGKWASRCHPWLNSSPRSCSGCRPWRFASSAWPSSIQAKAPAKAERVIARTPSPTGRSGRRTLPPPAGRRGSAPKALPGQGQPPDGKSAGTRYAGRLFAARFIRCVREGRPRGDVHPAPSRFALGLWLRMKPKKRQPLDFTGIPVEPPVEDVGRPSRRKSEPDADAPVSEPDLDLDIAAVPDASAPPILDRGPLDLGPDPRRARSEPIPETPRASARRGFFGRREAKTKPEPQLEIQPSSRASRRPGRGRCSRARSDRSSRPRPEVELQGARTEADPAPFSPARGRRSAPSSPSPWPRCRPS